MNTDLKANSIGENRRPTGGKDLSRRRPLWPAYACESLSSVGTSLLSVAIFFYTQHYFGWSMKENFMLAAAQGVVYVIGSLAAAPLVAKGGRRNSLIVIYSTMSAVALGALLVRDIQAILIIALVAHTFAASLNWPIVESLVTIGADAHEMSRRVGVYNLVWSITNTVIFAVSGTIIQHWPRGIFIVPLIAHAIAALLMLTNKTIDPTKTGTQLVSAPTPHEPPEPALIAKRTLAMWLARISLPATYVVIYSLLAMMPSLPILQHRPPATATLISATWMAARVAMFIILGATVWWHTRPSLLLISTLAMLVAFIGVTTRPSDLRPLVGVANQIDLISMLAFQILLGAAMGIIYSGSLYFGMVLSDGSTEHGGYHEALIGLGSVLGPGAAAITQQYFPNNVHAGVATVSGIVAITALAALIAAVRATAKPRASAL